MVLDFPVGRAEGLPNPVQIGFTVRCPCRPLALRTPWRLRGRRRDKNSSQHEPRQCS